ncbi:hypothetical protein DFH09DRAFT_1105808 [Mycena vulgaris]|nr:hypothetical protein DFH09DRAFT_1105808 [Mycena vulgaris]
MNDRPRPTPGIIDHVNRRGGGGAFDAADTADGDRGRGSNGTRLRMGCGATGTVGKKISTEDEEEKAAIQNAMDAASGADTPRGGRGARASGTRARWESRDEEGRRGRMDWGTGEDGNGKSGRCWAASRIGCRIAPGRRRRGGSTRAGEDQSRRGTDTQPNSDTAADTGRQQAEQG